MGQIVRFLCMKQVSQSPKQSYVGTECHCEENYFERSVREMEIKGSDEANPKERLLRRVWGSYPEEGHLGNRVARNDSENPLASQRELSC
ncbi:MAG TPA: hypothetical protein VI935_11380 [Thermodesulfobacteriota bacterium]|nr:hypothetical protein [Thermodesulfobacteriota bacterium]